LSNRGPRNREEGIRDHVYAEPFNINGRVHPGVSGKIRTQNSNGFQNMSDNEKTVSGN